MGLIQSHALATADVPAVVLAFSAAVLAYAGTFILPGRAQ